MRHRRGETAEKKTERVLGTKEGAAKVPWRAGVTGALRAWPVLASEAPHRKVRMPQSATGSSAES